MRVCSAVVVKRRIYDNATDDLSMRNTTPPLHTDCANVICTEISSSASKKYLCDRGGRITPYLIGK